jgi:hypothetical protein
MRRSTSNKVKVSILSPTGQVKSSKMSLSQIRLARLAEEKAKAQQQQLEGGCYTATSDLFLNH